MVLKDDYGINLRFWKPIVEKSKIVIIRRKIRWNKKVTGGYLRCQISENRFFFVLRKAFEYTGAYSLKK